MIWLIGIAIYSIIGVVLNTIIIAAIHNKTLKFSRQCIRNTLRWMDMRSWILFGGHSIFWLPMMLLALYHRYRNKAITWEF